MICQCRCHVVPGSDCTVDNGSSGVPGKPYCGVHSGEEVVQPGRPPTAGQCVNGCVKRGQFGRPDLPRRATRGLLCDRCADRLEEMLKDIAVDFATLAAVAMPGSAPSESVRHTKGAEAPTPVRLDVVALADGDRVGGARDPGDQRWDEELSDVPAVLPTLKLWADELRANLDPSRRPW